MRLRRDVGAREEIAAASGQCLSGVDNLCGYPETVGDHASGASADRAAAIALPNTNRLANVHLSLLQAAGVPATSFADSTMPIPGLLT